MVLNGIREVLSDDKPIGSDSSRICLKCGLAPVVVVKLAPEIKDTSCTRR